MNEIEQLKQRIAELEAQSERLRGGLNQAIELLVTALNEPQQITESEIHDLRTLEKSTPAQFLSEHNREVAVRAVEEFTKYIDGTGELSIDDIYFLGEESEEYANKIKSGQVKI